MLSLKQSSQLVRSSLEGQLLGNPPIIPAPIVPQVQVNPAKPSASHQDQLAVRMVLLGAVLFGGVLCMLAGVLLSRPKVAPTATPSPTPSPSPAVIVIPAPPAPDRGGCQLLCFGR